jgi:hypothetical protein
MPSTVPLMPLGSVLGRSVDGRSAAGCAAAGCAGLTHARAGAGELSEQLDSCHCKDTRSFSAIFWLQWQHTLCLLTCPPPPHPPPPLRGMVVLTRASLSHVRCSTRCSRLRCVELKGAREHTYYRLNGSTTILI